MRNPTESPSVSGRPAVAPVGPVGPLVRATALRRTHDGGMVEALRGVSLEIAAGEFAAISGPSGCGKSSLLRLLGALDEPTSGTVEFEGTDLRAIRNKSAFRARTVGFIFQSFHLLPALTAVQNVQVPMLEMPWNAKRRREIARELLHAVGLSAREDHVPAKLSGGERQRVAVARSLANGPRLLLADEPTGNLDSSDASKLMDLLARLHGSQGMTFVVVTHDPNVAARADRVIRMLDGRVLDPAPVAP